MIVLFCISEKWSDSGHILKLPLTTLKMTCATQRMYRRMGKNQCIPIKMQEKGKDWIGQMGYNFNIGHKEHIITIWKESLYEVNPVLTENRVYEPCLKNKATKYSSRKSLVSKRPENVHISGIILSLRTQCFVLYWTESKQDSSTGLDYRTPRHTYNLSLRKQCGQALNFFTRVRFKTRVEDGVCSFS